MKVIELLIDDEVEEAGGNALAMVMHPAHEVDFVKFKKEQDKDANFFEAFSNKSNIISPTEEQQKLILQQFTSTGADLQQFLIQGYTIVDVEPVGDISMKELNEKFSAININERPLDKVLEDKSIMDYVDDNGDEIKIRFRYTTRPGRPSILSTSRQFCKDMLRANKTYRFEDINKIANGFKSEYPGAGNWGDAMLRFGGPNCGHIFVKVTYKKTFNKDKSPKFKTIDEQTAGDAANIAGSNMNEKTQMNPSPQTVRRAGLGQFAKEDIRFDDYPQEARENAKRVLKYLEETGNPNDCLTDVGRKRAVQLANGENLSEDTLNRMKSFLSRHQGNERSGGANAYDEGCGNLALDAWGGMEILPWVEKKLNQIENAKKLSAHTRFSSEQIQKFNEELAKNYCLAGPILIPEKLIYRRDPKTNEEFYVFFSKESVKKIAYKYMRDSYANNTNIEHNPNRPIKNVTLAESWIVTNPDDDKSNQYGFNCVDGTWFGIVDCSKNMDFWNQYVENNKVLGFSLEGFFESRLVKFYSDKNSNNDIDTYILSEIENILNIE